MAARQIVVVSGPSGGGKSTLLRQLAARTLATQILARLPADAADRPVVEANNILKGDLSPDAYRAQLARPEGALVHYDIVFIHSHGLRRYEDDPALAPLETAEAPCVIFVKPDADTLQRQFADRAAQHRRAKSAASRLWAKTVRLPLRRLAATLRGRRVPSTCALYREPHWLAATCYPLWEEYLRRLAQRRPQTRILVVTPAAAPDGKPGFRLEDDSVANSPPPTA